MGKLIYAGTTEIGFDDRVLAHLQIVVGLKLRRKEGFFFSWRDEQSVGDGRSAIWIDPAIPLLFRYSGGRQPKINKAWLEAADPLLEQRPGAAAHRGDRRARRRRGERRHAARPLTRSCLPARTRLG